MRRGSGWYLTNNVTADVDYAHAAMATAEEALPAEVPDSVPSTATPDGDVPQDESLKRRASEDHDSDRGSPKRARRADTEDASADPAKRSASPPRRRLEEVPSNVGQERLKSATQEEKKRGKRLFGGLLSTLSQTTANNAQHKRRQEIEKKQHERLQKQKLEDDHLRTQKLEHLHEVRMGEQTGFEERVIRTKHAKKLATARCLRTRAEPPIYYLPWRRTAEQEDIISDQIREAEASIERELEDFETRKQHHREQHIPSHRRSLEDGSPGGILKADAPATSPPDTAEEPLQPKQEAERDHDESGDIMVETNEDTVIY